MRARLLFVTLGCTLVVRSAAAEEEFRKKIDPQLALQYRARAKAKVLVRIDSRENDAELARRGARVLERTGSIALAELELEHLPALGASPAVQRIAATHKLQLRLDEARAGAGVAPLSVERPDLTGEGVVVAVIDSGIDWTHETFKNPDGTTRIEAIWDLCDPTGPAPRGFEDYGGTLITAAEINLANGGGAPLRHQDVIGHGTFVTSIAAGSGRAGEPTLAGMAPKAAIVMVSVFGDETGCNNPFFDVESDASLTIALKMIHRVAAGRPVSVNMSLGSDSPFGDGVSLLEQELTQWVREIPGRSLAVAAANSGHDYHWGFTLTRGEPARVLHLDYLPAISMSFSAEAPLKMRVVAEDQPCAELPGAENELMSFLEYHGPTPLYRAGYLFSFAPSDAIHNLQVFETGIGEPEFKRSESACFDACDRLVSACGLDLDGEESYYCVDNCLFFNRDEEISCLSGAESCDAARACVARKAALELSLAEDVDQARVDVWLTNIGTVRATGAAHEMNMGDPAGAKNILAAGTYVQRDRAVVPGFYGPADGVVGDLASYSSRGPLIDGRLGIALAAPAELISGALSSSSWEAADVMMLPGAIPGWGTWNGGTSAGAPILAGVAALLLQANPQLTSTELREAMLLGGRRDQYTGATPNPAWGFGKVDALASSHTLQVVRADADGDGYTALAEGGLDCNDDDVHVHPEALEVVTGVDDNCDGRTDETLPTSTLPYETLDEKCAAPIEEVDAGIPADSGAIEAPDSGAMINTDAGMPPPAQQQPMVDASSSCGCASAGGGDSVSAALFLLFVALLRRSPKVVRRSRTPL